VVTFTVKSTTAGADVFTATDTTDSVTVAQTGTVTFTAGAASQVVFTTQPSASTVAGVAFAQQPVVTIEDQFGNTVTSGSDSTVSVALTLTTGVGSLGGTTSMAAVGGVANFAGEGLNINLAGTNKVLTATATVTAGTKTATTSPAFAITFATATNLVYTSVPGTGTAGTAFSVTVQVQDTYGNPANPTSSTTISLTKATGGGALSGTLAGSIGTNANSVTISGVVYSYADTMTLTATATAGMTSLTAVTSGNIVFSPGGPPVANAAAYSRAEAADILISVTNLLAQSTSDAYGDPVGLVSLAGGLVTNNSVIATTTNGTVVFYVNPYIDGTAYIYLDPTNNLTESFAYVVNDINYPLLTATNYITISVTNAVGQASGSIATTNGTVVLTWAGIPGTTNITQRATIVSGPWTNLWTNIVPTAGVFTNIDASPPQPSAYYRLEQF
jgi:hypothetical protein